MTTDVPIRRFLCYLSSRLAKIPNSRSANSTTMSWPHSIPAGLRRRIDSVLGQRSHGAAEIWGEVRDWLEENGVEMPEGIEVEQAPEGGAQRDQ